MTHAAMVENRTPATLDPATGALTETNRQAARPDSGKRLAGIDGLRAVAALWVVLFHIRAFSGARLGHVPGLDLFLRSGSTGVSLFLVLSGLCLYLPFAGGRTARFKTREFFVRRCRRLMPAYYASLVFALILTLGAGASLGFPHLGLAQATWQIVTHATLTHTLFPSTFYTLNGAYWSLGLEWQLYLALPLLVWGVRRFGLRKTATAAILCNVAYRLGLAAAAHYGVAPRDGVLATVVLPNQLPGRWAEFVFGMIAAELYVTGQIGRWANKAKYVVPVLIPVSLLATRLPLSHLLFGGVFFGLVVIVLASNNVVAKVFSWQPLVAIGTMSYSLYLVHQPVIQGIAYLARVHGHYSPTKTFAILMLLLPVVLLLAWVLFMTVERHTLNTKHASGSRTDRSAAKHAQRRWFLPYPAIRAIADRLAWMARPSQ